VRTLLVLLALLAPVQDERIQKGTTPSRHLRPTSDPALQALLGQYEFTEAEFPWTLRETRQGEKFTQYWLSFPSDVRSPIPEHNTVWCRFWQPKDGLKRRPAAILLHWLGGNFDTLEIVGQRMAEQGIATLMLYMPGYGPRKAKDAGPNEKLTKKDMEAMILGLHQTVLDIRRAGDWLARRPDVEPSRIGLVGISLGAVVGSLAAGIDDHFGRSVFLIGGGDLPVIVWNGSKETADAKAKLEKEGFTVEQLRERWRDVDPLTFASRVRPEEVLLINADADEVIPKAATERLRAAMGDPEIHWIKGGHYSLLFQLGRALKDITAHLLARTVY
jgi:dienelactone hydrolase